MELPQPDLAAAHLLLHGLSLTCAKALGSVQPALTGAQTAYPFHHQKALQDRTIPHHSYNNFTYSLLVTYFQISTLPA